MKNVLIVDDNLGFLYWLGETLAGAHYQPWPASNAPEANAMLRSRQFSHLDLLVVNPALRGIQRLVQRLRTSQPNLKVLAVDPVNDKQVQGVDAWRARPNGADNSARTEWLREVERVFGSHKPFSQAKSAQHHKTTPHHKRSNHRRAA
jgi:CheY-like chemotaxis protein